MVILQFPQKKDSHLKDGSWKQQKYHKWFIVNISNSHTLYPHWKEIPTTQVEIIFDLIKLTEESIREIINEYTDDDFTIVKNEYNKTGKTRIINFNEAEKVKNLWGI